MFPEEFRHLLRLCPDITLSVFSFQGVNWVMYQNHFHRVIHARAHQIFCRNISKRQSCPILTNAPWHVLGKIMQNFLSTEFTAPHIAHYSAVRHPYGCPSELCRLHVVQVFIWLKACHADFQACDDLRADLLPVQVGVVPPCSAILGRKFLFRMVLRCFKPLNHSRFPGFQLLKGLGSQNVRRLLDFQVPRNTQDKGNGLPNLADARAVASIFFFETAMFEGVFCIIMWIQSMFISNFIVWIP